LSKNDLSPKDKSISSINTQAIEDLLKSNEMIASVEAYKTPSGMIKLEIEQKIPIMRIMSTTGDYYIDNNGKVMPISRRYSANVPFVSGYVEKDVMLPDLFKFALFLQSNKFWNNQIDQIYIQQNGEVQLIPRVGNHKIVLGSFDDFEEKLDNLSLFYKKVIPKVGWEKYEVINLTYKNQIVCTKR
jgi:cell division protein FtsQ